VRNRTFCSVSLVLASLLAIVVALPGSAFAWWFNIAACLPDSENRDCTLSILLGCPQNQSTAAAGANLSCSQLQDNNLPCDWTHNIVYWWLNDGEGVNQWEPMFDDAQQPLTSQNCGTPATLTGCTHGPFTIAISGQWQAVHWWYATAGSLSYSALISSPPETYNPP
jgi:hypothetical protein